MWVRVATFEGVDKEKIDRLIKERMSAGEMTQPEGLSSTLVLDDTDARKRKFFTFFDSREAIEAAETGFDKMGDTISEDIRGKRTSVHYYEVVVYDGDVDNAKAARVTVLEGSPDAIDASLEKTRGDTLPKVRDRRERRRDRTRGPRQRPRLDDHAVEQLGRAAGERAGGRPAARADRRHRRAEDRQRRALRGRDGADRGRRSGVNPKARGSDRKV